MLSKKSKYAINALVFLAKQDQTKPTPISQIARELNLSRKFLEAILLDLKNAAILNSSRGKMGGYWLQKSTEEIDMAEVMRLFDGPIALLPCATHNYYQKCDECIDEATCGIRQVFLIIRNQTVAQLKEATLHQIISTEANLQQGQKEK